MGWVLPTLTFLIGIGILVAVVIVKIVTSKAIKKFDVIENAPLVEIDKSRVRFTNGYSRGILKKQTPCKNGCTRIEFFPSDNEQGENKIRPEMQRFVVKNEFLKPHARGEDSYYREIIKTVARFRKDIPEKMLDTVDGDEMEKRGQLAFLKKVAGKYVGDGDDAISELMDTQTRIGITKKALASLKEEVEALKKIRGMDSYGSEKK